MCRRSPISLHNGSGSVAQYIGEVKPGVQDLLTVFLRTILFYFVALILIRLMGKREVGQLSPFDLVVAIMIAEAAVFVIDDPRTSVWTGLIPMTTLAALQIVLSCLCIKFPRLMSLINGRPTVIIDDGQINEGNMRRSRYTVHELMEQLRQQQSPSLPDVQYAILEMSGSLSVIPKTKSRPVQVQDLNMDLPAEGLPAALVVDATINYDGLHTLGRDREWLMGQLQQAGAPQLSEIFVAAVDRSGSLWWQRRES